MARLLWLRAGLALCTLVLALGLGWVMPAPGAAPGWIAPILAFEFARAPADLAFLTGPDAAGLRAAMDAGHKIDAFFPFAYAGLVACFAAGLAPRKPVVAGVGVVCALLAAPLDLWENSALVAITAALELGHGVDAQLGTLLWATSAKWLALAGGALSLAIGLERRWLRWLSGAVAVSIPVAVVTATPWVCDGMGGVVQLWFAGLMAVSAMEIWPLVRGSSASESQKIDSV